MLTNASCPLNHKSAISFGPKNRREEKAICPRKQQNTIARQHITMNMPPSIIMKRQSITKLATIRQLLTTLIRHKVICTTQFTTQQRRPHFTRNITGTKRQLPVHSWSIGRIKIRSLFHSQREAFRLSGPPLMFSTSASCGHGWRWRRSELLPKIRTTQ